MLRVPGTVAVARRRAGRGRAGRRRLQRRPGRGARASRPTRRSCSSRPGSRPPRSPRRRCSGRSAAELLGAVGPQVHPAGHGDRRRDAGHARRRIPRGGPRRDDHRLGRVRAVRRDATAFRSSSPASSRSTSSPGWCGWSSSFATGKPAGREHVPALRDERRQPPRAGAALERVPADRRALARHRPRSERQPPPARRVRALRRAPAVHDRPRVALGLRAVRADRGVHLRRHHVRHRLAARLPAVRQGVRARTRRSAPAWCRSEGTCKIWHQYGGIPIWAASVDDSANPSGSTTEPSNGVRQGRDTIVERITLKHGAGGRAMRASSKTSSCRARRSSRRRDVGLAAMDDGAAICDRRPLARRHDRLARRSPDVLPRRRHRPARVCGHGERPRDDGRDRGARAHLRRRSSRRASRATRPRAHAGVDAPPRAARPARASSPATRR